MQKVEDANKHIKGLLIKGQVRLESAAKQVRKPKSERKSARQQGAGRNQDARKEPVVVRDLCTLHVF